MKRTLCLLILLAILLCGCSTAANNNSAATPDSAASEASTTSVTSAATEKPTSPPTQAPTAAPTVEQLAEQKIQAILKSKLKSDRASIDIDPLEQYPELPTGCEIVALTMALNCFGCKLDKTEVADNYIVYGDSYAISYVGDPYSDGGAGIWPLGIISSVDNYNAASGKSIYAYNTSHLPLSDLYKFIEAGCPALVWTTYYMDEPMYTDDGEYYNDEYYMWYDNEHCVTLYGYDRSAGTVDIADPLQGAVTVDAKEFERLNNDIGGWSVILLDASALKPTGKAKK